MTVRTAILDDYQSVALALGPWDEIAADIAPTVFTDHIADDDAVVERLEPFEVIVAMRERTPFPRAVLQRLPALKLVVTTGRTNAAIDIDAARELGITVAGTGSLAAPPMELTWALILALCRNVAAEDAHMRAGGWQRTIGPELAGRTLGLLGLGRLGVRMAAIAQAFEMRPIAWSQNLTAEHATAHGVEAVTKDELFRQADVVTIHLKLSARTRHLVGAAELAAMKPGAYLVNTSRGPLVDEAALLEALNAGTIAGAGLDVYDTEPLPADHPLRSAPNTVLTPHLGYVSIGNYELFFRGAVDCIAGYLRGDPVGVLNA